MIDVKDIVMCDPQSSETISNCFADPGARLAQNVLDLEKFTSACSAVKYRLDHQEEHAWGEGAAGQSVPPYNFAVG